MQKVLVSVVAAWLLLPAGVFGSDWTIEGRDADFPADRVVYSFSGGKVRVDGLVDGLVFLADLPAGEGFIVDEKAGKYAGGRIDEIARMMEPRGRTDVEDEEPGGEDDRPATVMPEVRFERVPGDESVAGFATRHYRVYLEELLVEELWLAPEIDTAAVGGSLTALLQTMTGNRLDEDFPPGYEEQGSYRELLKEGCVLRRITYFREEENRFEVVKAERTSLPSLLFEVPEEMEKVPYRRLFLGRD